MIRYLTLAQVLRLQAREIDRLGGAHGIRVPEAVEAALDLMQASFGGEDLYPSLAEKAAALGFSLIQNHPFLDGNKRAAYQAMEAFLLANGYEFGGDVDEQERVILAVAAGAMDREPFTEWVQAHVRPVNA